jgi:hypothetical protein
MFVLFLFREEGVFLDQEQVDFVQDLQVLVAGF